MSYKPDYQYLPPFSAHVLTPLYDAVNSLVGLGPRFLKKVLAVAEIRSGDVVVDIGCGTGVLLALGKKQFPNARFIGIDPDAQALEIAKRRFRKNDLDVEIVRAFGESTGLPDASVNVIMSSLALHHLPEHAKVGAIREMYRILKPGGEIIIADFGPTRMKFITYILPLFENVEYLKGNLKGMLVQYLHKARFENVQILKECYPSIQIIKAKKESRIKNESTEHSNR